ncbi:LamG-like jellyroll fold domain-containing protein [Actinoplanes sp. NPDC051513]|uniref:LamG-like jellyroll fold domain-containing protein n=1 Tax=Actinoplanes sp. NPDC051513 TaxID=3363908 RepID=UPI0037AF010B
MLEHEHSHTPTGPNRRDLLRSAALAGAGAGVAAFGPLSVTPTFAGGAGHSAGRWDPDPAGPQFTLAIMPDTQFLYWGSQNSINSAPQEESFRYIIDSDDDNIVFMAHLGDLTQDADATSFQAVGKAFDLLDSHGVAYSVLAGNHDVSGDDTRGTTPYLQTMGPQRFRCSKTFAGADATGYNTAHIFRAGGREWLLLALDWRMSAPGFAWANKFIKDHPGLPVIVTTHDLVGSPYDDNVYPYESGDPENNAILSGYGQQLWDGLIDNNDQIFLTINGHYWPPGRTTRKNAAGNDVHLHITNYQNRYFGGAAMLRLYHFDLARGVIDVETVAPYFLAQDPELRSPLAAQHLRLTTPVDQFSMPLDLEKRFPASVRPARPSGMLVVPGTLAYWRFDNGGVSGSPVTAGQTVRDRSGRGNDLTVAAVAGSAAEALTWSGDHHPDQPAHASLRFTGGRNPLHGGYLTTGAKAPLNAETFNRGYTIEAFLKIPLDWDAGNNAWMSVLTRRGRSGDAGKSGKNADPKEPLAGLNISNNGREPQFNFYPLNQTYPTTNWGHGLFEEVWWHVAVVNDGKHTTMYVEGSPVVDNPSTLSVGIASLGLPWLFGGHEYAGAVDNVFHGWIGDVRIVNRPLPVDQFMIGK